LQDSKIAFFTEDIDFKLSNESVVAEWIENCIASEGKKAGNLTFVFCSDEYLLPINIQYLNHDTFTDIITFNYVEENTISGDIFISVDRVKENAEKLKATFKQELCRVIIHGVLHLIGYNDKTPEEAHQIRAREDFYLTLCP